MNNVHKSAPLLGVLFHVCKKYSKLYCYPSQMSILKLLEQYQSVNYSLRTLNRHLKAAEDAGYIIRVRRIVKDKKKGTLFRSTLYKITLPGYYLLKKLGVPVWKEIHALVTQGIKVGQDALGKRKGLKKLSLIIQSMQIFPDRQKKYLLEKQA